MKIVALTSCAGGIAHTYMAAEGLKKAAKAAGDEIKVEIQGSMGVEHKLTQADIDEADLVIFAADIALRGMERFRNKHPVEIRPGEAIADFHKALQEAKEKARLNG